MAPKCCNLQYLITNIDTPINAWERTTQDLVYCSRNHRKLHDWKMQETQLIEKQTKSQDKQTILCILCGRAISLLKCIASYRWCSIILSNHCIALCCTNAIWTTNSGELFLLTEKCLIALTTDFQCWRTLALQHNHVTSNK